MKLKISPAEYRNILEAIELDTLYLSELNTKYREENILHNLKLAIDEKYSFTQENNILKVHYIYKLSAKDESKDEATILISARYIVRYLIIKDVEVTKDFMKIFCDLTIGMLLWTYFRELVNNSLYRMGMPPLVLPLKKKLG